jgi:hypothetical protein
MEHTVFVPVAREEDQGHGHTVVLPEHEKQGGHGGHPWVGGEKRRLRGQE